MATETTGYLALYFGDRGPRIALCRTRAEAAARSEHDVRAVNAGRFVHGWDSPTPVVFTPADRAWRELRPLFGEV